MRGRVGVGMCAYVGVSNNKPTEHYNYRTRIAEYPFTEILVLLGSNIVQEKALMQRSDK